MEKCSKSSTKMIGIDVVFYVQYIDTNSSMIRIFYKKGYILRLHFESSQRMSAVSGQYNTNLDDHDDGIQLHMPC